ncbi:hypothetical protein AGMMS49965_07460 [Bacteroidia bacterium]|nr:hypothetical protein AGMMS49965_07460 [Bacteroidia bacterium]
MQRPELNSNISAADFKDFYWFKEELTAFCKSKGLAATGRKPELTARIIAYLQTGEVVRRVNNKKYTSKFDWNKATLDLDTEITDNYKNTENVREFLRREIGAHFRFNVPFGEWMKQNCGKTLRDAIHFWKMQREQRGKTAYSRDDLLLEN